MSESNGTVLVERRGPVAIVTLNRPEKHNAVNSALGAALAQAMARLDADEDVRCVVLTGAGERAFCAGADMAERLAEMEGSASQPNHIGEGIASVARMRKPVIGAINGFAYGGGALLAVNTDIRLASPNASFRFVGASYGLVVGGSQLPRIVGPAYAKELLFTARPVDAAEAERIGLVNRVVWEGSVLEAALTMAQEIAANSPAAVEWSKRVIDAATEVDHGRAAEAEANRALRGSDDHTSRFREAAGRITGAT